MSGEVTNCTTSHVMAEADYDPVEVSMIEQGSDSVTETSINVK